MCGQSILYVTSTQINFLVTGIHSSSRQSAATNTEFSEEWTQIFVNYDKLISVGGGGKWGTENSRLSNFIWVLQCQLCKHLNFPIILYQLLHPQKPQVAIPQRHTHTHTYHYNNPNILNLIIAYKFRCFAVNGLCKAAFNKFTVLSYYKTWPVSKKFIWWTISRSSITIVTE